MSVVLGTGNSGQWDQSVIFSFWWVSCGLLLQFCVEYDCAIIIMKKLGWRRYDSAINVFLGQSGRKEVWWCGWSCFRPILFGFNSYSFKLSRFIQKDFWKIVRTVPDRPFPVGLAEKGIHQRQNKRQKLHTENGSGYLRPITSVRTRSFWAISCELTNGYWILLHNCNKVQEVVLLCNQCNYFATFMLKNGPCWTEPHSAHFLHDSQEAFVPLDSGHMQMQNVWTGRLGGVFPRSFPGLLKVLNSRTFHVVWRAEKARTPGLNRSDHPEIFFLFRTQKRCLHDKCFLPRKFWMSREHKSVFTTCR